MAERQSGITHGESFWDVPGVSYRGETGTYREFKKMTPSMNLDELAEWSEKERQEGNPHAIDSILNYAIWSQAYSLRQENPETAESLRVSIQQSLRIYPNTLSAVIYTPKGRADRLVHNYGTSDCYTLEGDFVGPDGLITNIPERFLEAVLGEQDPVKIDEVFRWINRTDSYVYRVNSKPGQRDERVVRFRAGSGRLDLNCNRNPLNRYPAFQIVHLGILYLV